MSVYFHLGTMSGYNNNKLFVDSNKLIWFEICQDFLSWLATSSSEWHHACRVPLFWFPFNAKTDAF